MIMFNWILYTKQISVAHFQMPTDWSSTHFMPTENWKLLNVCVWIRPFMNVRCTHLTNTYRIMNAQAHTLIITFVFRLCILCLLSRSIVITIICSARIFLPFIFYRSHSRQWFWLQCNGLQCFYLARMPFVHHIRAMAVCAWQYNKSDENHMAHNGMRVMPIKISVTAPFAVFNYKSSKTSKYSFTKWTFVTSSWMQRRSTIVSSRYFLTPN